MSKEFWFVVGSQDLYGEEVLKTVAERAAEMAADWIEREARCFPFAQIDEGVWEPMIGFIRFLGPNVQRPTAPIGLLLSKKIFYRSADWPQRFVIGCTIALLIKIKREQLNVLFGRRFIGLSIVTEEGKQAIAMTMLWFSNLLPKRI